MRFTPWQLTSTEKRSRRRCGPSISPKERPRRTITGMLDVTSAKSRLWPGEKHRKVEDKKWHATDAVNTLSGLVGVKQSVQTVKTGVNFHMWGGQ